jgi:hypothetical protein
MNVLSAYRSLNAEQKRILTEKQVDLTRPIEELLTLLKPLAGCDAVADKARTRLGCTAGAALVLMIPLTIVLGNTAGAAVAYFVFGVLLALGIGALSLYIWTRRIDISNNFREFIMPVLSVFREDIDPAHPVHLKLDLTPPTAKTKLQSEGEPYKRGSYYKIIDKVFVDKWMTASAVLVDGSRLSWSITDEIRERSKTKKNPRGKIKTKTKYRKKTDIAVELGLRAKAYDIEAPAEAEIKRGEKRNTVRLEREQRSDSLDPIAPAALIDVITDIFRNARPAKKEAGA